MQSSAGSTAHALDINNDGITDATMTASLTSFSNKAVKVSPSTGSQIPMYGPILLAKSLNNNAIIGPVSPSGTSWQNAQNAVLRQVPLPNGNPGGPNPIPFGDWSNTTDRYFSIRFLIGEDWCYGWVRVSVATTNGISFTIKDYAHNSIANQQILAGETSCSVPTITLAANGSLSICNGDSVQLTALSDSAYLFQWFKDENPIAGANTSTFTASDPGAYYVKASNSCGDINSTVDTVSFFEVDTSVTVLENTLTANAASATYQWIDCSTMQEITGATAQTFSPSQSGDFAVMVTENNCSATSSCFALIVSGTHENLLASGINLYPNPATSLVTIDLGSTYQKVEITITDVIGKKMYSTTVSDAKEIEVNTKDFAAGMYKLHIQTDNFVSAKTFIVKK